MHLQFENILKKDNSLFGLIGYNGNSDERLYNDVGRLYRTSVNNGGSIMFESKHWNGLKEVWKNNKYTSIEEVIQIFMDKNKLECVYPGISRIRRILKKPTKVYDESETYYDNNNLHDLSTQYDV